MNAEQKRKLDKGERELAFMNDNAGDFPGGTPGGGRFSARRRCLLIYWLKR